MEPLKPRAKTLDEIADGAVFLFLPDTLTMEDKAAGLLRDAPAGLLADVTARLRALADWTAESVAAAVRENADAAPITLGKRAPPPRAALTRRRDSRHEQRRVGTECVSTGRHQRS